jgi:hypothetical protein
MMGTTATGSGELVTVDLATGQFSSVPFPSAQYVSISFYQTNTLIGSHANGTVYELVSINPSTGSTSVLSTTDIQFTRGDVAIDYANNKAYMMGTTATWSGELVTVDLATGQFSSVPFPSAQYVSICFYQINTTYSISGTIESGGSGISGASVTLTLGGVTTGITTTDSNGNYSFTALSNGSYTVTASKSGYTFTPDNVTINGGNSTGDNIVAYASSGRGGTPVGYSQAWFIITLISLTLAGGYLMRNRIASN